MLHRSLRAFAAFSSRNGPYNPNRYRHYLTGNFFQSNQELKAIAKE